MKLTPVSGPLPPATINETARRAKMINAFNNATPAQEAPKSPSPQAQETAVANPNRVSPEELSAIKPSTREMAEKPEDTYNSAEVADTSPKTSDKDPELERQFRELSRRERQMRARQQQQEQTLKAREAELAAKEAAIKSKEQEYTQGYISKDQLKADTLRILSDAGVSYDDLTQQILSQGSVDPATQTLIQRLEKKIQQLEEKASTSDRLVEESQKQQYQAALRQIEMDVKSTVQNDPNFETIRATKSIPDVVQLIEEVYNKDGRLMTVEEACSEVEKYLVDEALKLTRIGKIKRQLSQTGQSDRVSQTAKVQQTQQMKTLTNAVSSTRKLSAKERAILAFKGELKN